MLKPSFFPEHSVSQLRSPRPIVHTACVLRNAKSIGLCTLETRREIGDLTTVESLEFGAIALESQIESIDGLAELS